MTNRVLGWLGLGRPDADSVDGIAAFLRQKGVSAETLELAAGHQLSLNTRLASTLVVRGELDESEAVDALSRFLGLPGLCLRSSIIDLSGDGMPESVARDHQILPVQVRADGNVVLACADPPNDARLQEYEVALGRRVQPYLALELYLCRTIDAFYRLRSECADAVHLLGDEVDAENLPGPEDHLVSVFPTAEVPNHRQSSADMAPDHLPVLLGMLPTEHRGRLAQRFSQLGLHVLLADDGPSAMRAIVSHSPSLIALEALLPGRAGVDIMVRLGNGDLYQSCTKVLLLAHSSPCDRSALSEIEGLSILDASTFDTQIETLVDGMSPVSECQYDLIRHRSKVALCRGRCLHQDGQLDEAAIAFGDALDLDPLLPEAQLGIAKTYHSLGKEQDAADAYSLVIDLGGARATDVATLAEIVQRGGNLRLAERLWRKAALHFDDPEISARLSDHAATLWGGRPSDAQ